MTCEPPTRVAVQVGPETAMLHTVYAGEWIETDTVENLGEWR